MHKFFVTPDSINESKATITGDDVKHIYKVLRLKAGDKIVINDTRGNEYLGSIENVNKAAVDISILEKVQDSSESPIKITLFQGLPKSAKMDYIVQKGTEIGINEIIPIITGRVVVKNEIGEYKKTDRWQRIALEACKQCKRSSIPKIASPIEFNELLELLKAFDTIVVPYENEAGLGIKKMVSDLKHKAYNIAVIIGPEGGFEESEIDELSEMGAYIVTLGPRILRTETAGIVCSAILEYELGDMGGKI